MEQQAESRREEATEETGIIDVQGKASVALKPGQLSSLDWATLVLATAAVACAFLPWLKVGPLLAGGVGALSGLIDSWTNSSGALPTPQDQYSIFAFPALADAIDGYVSLLKTVGAAGYLDTSEAVGYLNAVYIATYVIFAFWLIGIVLTVAGGILYVASKGRRKALFVAGISLVTALALMWACAYNVVPVFVDGAENVISGVSPWSIVCFALGLAAIVCVVVARTKAAEKSEVQKTDEVNDVTEDMERVDDEKAKLSASGTKKVVGIVACGAAIVLLIVALVVIVPHLYSGGTSVDADAVSSESNTGLSTQGGSESDETPVAAVLGGNILEEQAVTDYIDEFREASELTSDQDWIAWMQAQGYTPESVRDEVLDYLLTEWALEIACEENGIEITQDDIEAYLVEVRSSFEGEDAYQTALSESGMTEESYVDDVVLPEMERGLLAQKVLSEDELEDEEALAIWLANYRNELGESIRPMPDGLPYDVS